MKTAVRKNVEYHLHRMFCHYLDGEFDEAKKFETILHTIEAENTGALSRINKWDKKRLLMMKKSLKDKEYSNIKVIDIKGEEKVDATEFEVATSEKKLHKILVKNEGLLREVTGLNLKCAGFEQETQYGFVDIMAYTSIYAVPIEVKLNRANHTIVAQIQKYMKSYLYKVNYGIWRDVIGVTVASEYSDNALQELRKINVIPLVYTLLDNKLSLKRINRRSYDI